MSEEGVAVVIMGVSGAGKSSVAAALAGRLDLTRIPSLFFVCSKRLGDQRLSLAS